MNSQSKMQFLWNIFSFVALLVCVMVIVNCKGNESSLKDDINKWKSIAESEKEVPNINDKAKEFLKELSNGNSKEYLTGQALKEYNDAKKEKDTHEGHHDDEPIDSAGQRVKIFNSTTEKTNTDQATSVILYQLIYKSPFDQKDKGVIDQRILTLMMKIDWKKVNGKYKVEKFDTQLLNDNLDNYLSSLGDKE
ncbi:hypothetical protein [Bacillus subtilis]|uniref:hypothetical protein n=1 Tax=Bacillus subtilis TaxID=1423 RepID=UPI001B9694AF|nr:hypothetical protein [Bacillus subtilis]CAI6330492.1 hypothetical protein NRS6096_21785 [Bacillus subtilis]